MQFWLPCNSCNCEVGLCIMSWLSLNFIQRICRLVFLEPPSILTFPEIVHSECLEVLFSFTTTSSCSQTCSLSGVDMSEMGVLQFPSRNTSLLQKFTSAKVYSCHVGFLVHEFRPRFRKQIISGSINKRLRNICSLLLPRKCWSPRKICPNLKMCFDSAVM